MKSPWLSIVTITKDDPAGFARTFASTTVWRSEPGVEQLVVFAGKSIPDVSGECVQLLHQHSIGISGAFNEGLAQARGEWVWFLNGGDAIYEALNLDWLRTLLQGTQAQVVTGALLYDGEATARTPPPLSAQWPMLTSWLAHPATIVRRTALVAAGGFDPRWTICMDFDLWHRLIARSFQVDVVAMPFARFDVNGISRRSENLCRLYRENAEVLWQHKGNILQSFARNSAWILRVFFRAARSRWL